MWVIHVELELPQDLIQDLFIVPQHLSGQVKRSRDQDQWRFCPIGGAADPLQGIIYIAGCYRGNVLALCNRGNLLRTVMRVVWNWHGINGRQQPREGFEKTRQDRKSTRLNSSH